MSLSNKFAQLGRVMTDARWWPFYLQRRVMAPRARDRVAGAIAGRLRPHATAAAAGNPRARELRATGISHFGPLLSDEQAGELQRYFLGKPVHDPYRDPSRRFLPDSAERHPDSHIAHHGALDIIRAPYLFGLANRPDILAVAADFLGCKPTLGYLACWWSYHTRLGAQQAEHFHRDVDDWRFVKLFVYLTDVAADNGPHIYVARSANSPALRRIRRYDDAEVVQAFGRDNVLELTARAGEGFMEDTFGMHKGQPVASGRRLIFQAVYSMFALPYGPKSTVARIDEVRLPDGSRPDPWINRLYLSS